MKQIISLILPVTAAILVPRSVEDDWTVKQNIQTLAGAGVMLVGLSILVACILAFIRVGKGTLAPWSPPKNFVVTGLYRFVRNPMILGVFIILMGEAIAFNSIHVLAWAGAFFVINTIYFLLFEEPQLEERFGNDYREYKKNVNRWLPRFRPYDKKAISH